MRPKRFCRRGQTERTGGGGPRFFAAVVVGELTWIYVVYAGKLITKTQHLAVVFVFISWRFLLPSFSIGATQTRGKIEGVTGSLDFCQVRSILSI